MEWMHSTARKYGLGERRVLKRHKLYSITLQRRGPVCTCDYIIFVHGSRSVYRIVIGLVAVAMILDGKWQRCIYKWVHQLSGL